MARQQPATPEPDLAERLRATPLFDSLPRQVLDEICRHLEPLALDAGEVLFRRTDADRALYVLLDGRLAASRTDEDGETTVLGEIGPGEAVGEIQLLTGGERTADVHAREPSRLVRLPAATVDWLAESAPEVLGELLEVIRLRLRHNQLAALAGELFGIDEPEALAEFEREVEWVRLASGEQLFAQGDPGNGLWVVVSGLIATVLSDGRVVGEVARGELLGEMAVVTGEPRAAAAYALRDSDLVWIGRQQFERLVQRDPRILMGITRRVVSRLRQTLHAETRKAALNIALVAVDPEVPLGDFAARMAAGLAPHGEALHLSAARLDGLLGSDGLAALPPEDPRSLRLASWLEEQEARHGFLVLETDPADTPWTRRCLQHAQRIVLVANGANRPAPGPVERLLPEVTTPVAPARRILVLLHPARDPLPRGTARWLASRQPDEHHHLRLDHPEDFERLGRFLSGHAVGLVLGGGGARGFAHFGVFLALREAGVPIDMIGGTSMGAVIGAQCALDWDRETMVATNRAGLIQKAPFQEYTLPMFSLVRSRTLDGVLKEAHGDMRIEDLWVRYFCVSSNLSRNEAQVHDRGSLWRALRASSALPGIVLPVVSREGLLVDGGLLNNLPGDLMREFCNTVIVVNVSSSQEIQGRYGRFPSPWQVMLARLLPFRSAPSDVPTILDVLMGSTMLSSVGRAQRVMADADLCLEPPIERFGLLEFEAMEDLVEVGYRYALGEIESWLEKGPPPWRGTPD